jgi:N-methylhydantoinase A/acetophenone carboxylase
MTTILNAYMHHDLSEELSALGEELRDLGYRKPLITVHNTGGMANVVRTAAVNTYNSGPVAGLMGGAHICKLYGLDKAVLTDMGGTTFDLGVLVGGAPRFYEVRPVIERFRTQLPMLEVRSIGAGGGSIAWINPALDRLQVGPKSAGAMPGPACYDMGGDEPTVTDADLVLGYLNPDYFLGGRQKLSKNKAIKAIKDKVADPLRITVEEAAYQIRKIVDATMGQEIFKEVALKGYNPKEFTLFAYGGAGPTHCCGYADYLAVSEIYTFPFSSVFSAFGSSTMDIIHVYERSNYLLLLAPFTGKYLESYEAFNRVVMDLQKEAMRDMKGEEFDPDKVFFALELDMRYGTQLFTTVVNSPGLLIQGEDDVKAICDAFIRTYAEVYSAASAYPEGGIEIQIFRIKAIYPLTHYQFPIYDLAGENPEKALKGKRQVYWSGAFQETDIYERKLIECGNIILGPAIIEAADTTYVIPPGKRFVVDKYLNGVIKQA